MKAAVKLIGLGLIILMTACNKQPSDTHVQGRLLIDPEFWSPMRGNYPDSDLSDERILTMAEEVLSLRAETGSIFVESNLAELSIPLVQITKEKHNSAWVTLMVVHDGELEIAFPSPLNSGSTIYYRRNNETELKPVEVNNQTVIGICQAIITQAASEAFSNYLKSTGELSAALG